MVRYLPKKVGKKMTPLKSSEPRGKGKLTPAQKKKLGTK